MSALNLLFIFSHPPSSSLANDAWDAAMTAGLLDQSVTIFFTGEGQAQLGEPAMVEKIASLQEILPLQLCVEGVITQEQCDESLRDQLQIIEGVAVSSFIASFDRVLSF